MFVPRSLVFAAALLALTIPAAAQAQNPASLPSQTALSRLSIGVNAGVFFRPMEGLLSLGGDGLLVVGPNLTFHTSRKRAIQLTSSILSDRSEYSSGMIVFYAVQYRRTFKDEGKSRSYWTIGGAGTVTRRHSEERTLKVTSPYGVTGGEEFTYHVDAYSRTGIRPPLFPVLGFGTERFVHKRLAVRGDVVVSLLAVRAAVGLSVPMGRLK